MIQLLHPEVIRMQTTNHVIGSIINHIANKFNQHKKETQKEITKAIALMEVEQAISEMCYEDIE